MFSHPSEDQVVVDLSQVLLQLCQVLSLCCPPSSTKNEIKLLVEMVGFEVCQVLELHINIFEVRFDLISKAEEDEDIPIFERYLGLFLYSLTLLLEFREPLEIFFHSGPSRTGSWS